MEITTPLYDTLEEGVDEPLEYELCSCVPDTPPETSDHPSKSPTLMPHFELLLITQVSSSNVP